jgi:glycosyltransferase involved in cell wall biosynthesis
LRLIICCGGFPSISETFVASEVLGLESRGHRVTVVAEEVSRALLDRLPAGVPSGGIHPLGRRGRHPLDGPVQKAALLADALPALPAMIGRSPGTAPFPLKGLRWTAVLGALAYRRGATISKAEMVHAHFGPTALWARRIAERQDIPLAVTFHGYDATSFPAELGWGAYAPLLRSPRVMFVAHSPFIAERVRLGLGVEAWAVPLGVDTRLFAPSDGAGSRDGSEGGPRLAFVGNLLRQKGVRVAVETLALLRRGDGGTPLKATLAVVGGGPEAESTRLLAEALGVDDAMRMHGPLPAAEVAGVLRSTDILLVPSSTDLSGAEEGYGLVCLEAQSCGTLVVGTDCGGLPAAVGPPVGGRCVPQQSPFAMAEAVRELWTRADLDELRMAARKRVLQFYSQEASLSAYEVVFDRLMAGAGSDRPRPDGKPEAEGPVRWSEMQSSERAPEEPRGSLVAYAGGKDVVEILRGSEAPPSGGLKEARSWTFLEAGSPAQAEGPHAGNFDLLLDLHGSTPERLLRERSGHASLLRPGGTAIFSIETEDSGVEHVRGVLEQSFRRVLPLDRLFFPGRRFSAPMPVSGAGSSVPDRSATRFRYFLCRV